MKSIVNYISLVPVNCRRTNTVGVLLSKSISVQYVSCQFKDQLEVFCVKE